MAFTMDRTDQVVLLLTVAATVFLYFRNSLHRTLPYPPGPRKLPLLGNLLDFPLNFGWETYAQWGREHNSDIIHLRAAGKDFIVLNSFRAATDLLDKKSLIYSSRPQFTMVTELMGWDWVFSAMVYGKQWKERRRLFQQYFSNRNVDAYRTQQSKFVWRALRRLLYRPDDFFEIIRHTIGGIAISLAYGLKIRDADDPFIDLAQRALQTVLDAVIPGAFLVDLIPWLKYVPDWMPGASFQKKAKMWRKLQEDLRELPYAEGVKNFASGTADPSLISKFLEKLDDSPDVERQQEVIKDIAGVVLTAATDTTIAAIKTFFAAMLCFPEVQKKAQVELDRVLGGRLPEFDDEPNLPYISALIKEVMRWRPAAPLGIPHQLTEDDVYEGYHVPKGAYVIANAWAMLQNEEDYPDPSSFRPERFLTIDGQLNLAMRDPNTMAFGFGRRICPGINVATSLLWIWVASFLSTFNISNALDEHGVPLEPSIEYHGLLSATFHPQPFKSTIRPRSKATEELIRSEVLPDA